MSATKRFRKLRRAILRLREILWSFWCYDPQKQQGFFHPGRLPMYKAIYGGYFTPCMTTVGGQPCGGFSPPVQVFLSVTEVARRSNHLLGGGNSNIFHFHPEPWENDPNWRAYFFSLGWFNHQLVFGFVDTEIFLTDSTILTHHSSTPFGIICLFFRALNKQIQVIFIMKGIPFWRWGQPVAIWQYTPCSTIKTDITSRF